VDCSKVTLPDFVQVRQTVIEDHLSTDCSIPPVVHRKHKNVHTAHKPFDTVTSVEGLYPFSVLKDVMIFSSAYSLLSDATM